MVHPVRLLLSKGAIMGWEVSSAVASELNLAKFVSIDCLEFNTWLYWRECNFVLTQGERCGCTSRGSGVKQSPTRSTPYGHGFNVLLVWFPFVSGTWFEKMMRSQFSWKDEDDCPSHPKTGSISGRMQRARWWSSSAQNPIVVPFSEFLRTDIRGTSAKNTCERTVEPSMGRTFGPQTFGQTRGMYAWFPCTCMLRGMICGKMGTDDAQTFAFFGRENRLYSLNGKQVRRTGWKRCCMLIVCLGDE